MTVVEIVSLATDENKVTLPETAGNHTKLTLPVYRVEHIGKSDIMQAKSTSKGTDTSNKKDPFTFAYDFKQSTMTIKISSFLETDWVAKKATGKTATDYKDYISQLKNHGGKVWIRVSTENEHFAKNAGGTNRHWTYDGTDSARTASNYGFTNWKGVYAGFIIDWNFIQLSDDDITDPSYDSTVTFLIAEQK